MDERSVGLAMLNLAPTVVGCMGAGLLGLVSIWMLLRFGAGVTGR